MSDHRVQDEGSREESVAQGRLPALIRPGDGAHAHLGPKQAGAFSQGGPPDLVYALLSCVTPPLVAAVFHIARAMCR
jgi:hypothetical protein